MAVSAVAAPEDEGDRFVAYGQAGYTHDSNITRSAQRVQADSMRALAAGVKWWMPVSLQRFDAKLDAQDVRYHSLTGLNYRSHQGEVGWDWRITPNAGGRLSWANSRRPVELRYLDLAERDVTNVNRISGTGFYRFMPEWQVEAGANRSKTEHTLNSRRVLNYDVDQYSAGFRYLPATGSSVGLTYSRLNAKYPNQQAIVFPGSAQGIDAGYRQDEVGVSVDWQVTGLTSLQGNVGHVRRTHPQVTARDYAGYTGRLGLRHQLTGKIRLQGTMWREIGGDEQSAYFNYALRNGIRIEPFWALSPKVQARMSWQYERLSYAAGNQGLFNIDPRVNRESQFTIGLDYEWMRNSTISLSFSKEHRDSTVENGDYDANTAGLTIRASY
ncbi:hypothetical protein HNQ59_002873 [Chitinivorax tropicus]|uniref:Uncharacterized protein n=2 Tax=Chitinivorax tropicus TaxID=714531 RepID=A0A840MWM3_9PROT|nr:hypothetical protein [Chitinivorax tropicus]